MIELKDLPAAFEALARRVEQLEAAAAAKSRQPGTPLADELSRRLRAAFALPNGTLPIQWLTATEIADRLLVEPGQIKSLGQVLRAAGFSRKSSRKDGTTAARYCVASTSR